MATRVGPTEKRITHDISLTNNAGTTVLGLKLVNPKSIGESPLQQTSLKMSQGDTDYSDFNLPFTPITQKDWAGGRAQENFEDDKTRYSDSYQVDTTHGDIRLAPAATLTTGIDTSEENGMSTALYTYFRTETGSGIGASNFVAAASTTYNSLDLLVMSEFTRDVPLTISIYTDTGTPAHAPNTLIAGTTSTINVPPTQSPTVTPVRFSMTFTPTAGTMYWIVASIPDSSGDFNDMQFGYYASTGNDLMIKPLGSWITDRANIRLSYRFTFISNTNIEFSI